MGQLKIKKKAKKGQVDDATLANVTRMASDAASELLAEELWKLENQTAAINLLVSLYALEDTVKDLKTLSRRMVEFVEHYSSALDKIQEAGSYAEAFAAMKAKYNINADFEEISLDDVLAHISPGKITVKIKEAMENDTECNSNPDNEQCRSGAIALV